MICMKGAIPIAAATLFLITGGPATAYVMPNKTPAIAQPNSTTLVRYRGHHWRRSRHWHNWHDHGDNAAAAGVGFAAGALLGSALTSRAYAPGGAVAYCTRHFRSYDPASGTYLGYDGLRHPCP
jgi:hypothetical protein